MSTRAEVQVLERGMTAPRGVRFSATALVFDDVNESTFLEAGAWLQRIEGCRAWWWGDYMLAYCAWKISQDSAVSINDPESVEKARVTYTTRYADTAGVSVETLRDWKGVAEFYPPPARIALLSFAHHREARDGISTPGPRGLPAALQWLARALQDGWSSTVLRGAIRTARIAATGQTEPLPPARQQELYAFTRWARSHLTTIDKLNRAQAEALRTELEPASKLIAALDAKLGVRH